MTNKNDSEYKKSNRVSIDRKSRVLVGLIWMLLIILGVFCGYEFIERHWLHDANPNVIYILHILRGVGTSVLVGVWAVWYTLRSKLPVFPEEQKNEGWALNSDPSSESRIIHFSEWFIRMRWLACIMGTILTIVTIRLVKYLDTDSFLPLLILIIILAISNIVYKKMLLLRWGIRYLAEIQIIADLFILTAMLHFSGGLENPMVVAYIFHVIIGGILLSKKKCYHIVVVAILQFSALAFLEYSGWLRHYTLLVLPHGIDLGGGDISRYLQLQELMAGLGDGRQMYHASNDPVFAGSMVFLLSLLMILTAYFITIIMDELRTGEQRRLAESQDFERIISATGAGFSIIDSAHKTIWLNEQLRKWLHIEDAQTDVTNEALKSWRGNDSAIDVTFHDEVIQSVERSLLEEDGSKRFYRTTIAPLHDSLGALNQVVELTQDISEQKVLQAETIHSGKLAAVGFMAAGIAHEVGNPLASLSTRLRLLENNPEKDFVLESIPLLRNQIDRIGRIVQDISAFSRPGKSDWNTCQVNKVLQEVLTVLRFHKHPKRIQIEISLQETLPMRRAIEDQLTTVFMNLGLNAINAMDEGGTLFVKSYVENDEIRVVFKDTGSGIKDEIREHLFTPFVSGREGGSGLGLSISQRMMETHGGRIEAENHPEGGAIFTVILPIN